MQKNSRLGQKQKFIVLLLILLSSAVIACSLYLLLTKPKQEQEVCYAGIGGAVKEPGVYQVTENTLLYELILKANGLLDRADVRQMNTDKKIVPFKVYCIPFLPKMEYAKVPKPSLTERKPKIPKMPTLKKFEKINIVYAGLPRTFIFISIFPEIDLIIATHIPYYTKVTFDYEYPRTLYEIYLTGGIPFLLRSVKRITKERIDYYFAQKRPVWINFINYLGGIEVNIPPEFAKEYGLKQERRNLDGLLSWEYIRFISKDVRKIDPITGSAWRIKRQKEFMYSMYKKFKEHNFMYQSEIAKNILAEAETNIKIDNLISMAYKIRKMKKPKLELLTIPGIVQEYNGQKMWITDLENYHLKIESMINELGIY